MLASQLLRYALRYALFVMLIGCGVFDFDTKRDLEEIIIQGDPEAHASGAYIAIDALGTQSWDQELPQIPSAIFVESFSVEISATSQETAQDIDDFSWLDRVVFYAEPTSTETALGRQPVAFANRPGAVQRIELQTNRALNLVPYILEGFRITSRVEGRVPQDDVSLIGTAVLGIDAL